MDSTTYKTMAGSSQYRFGVLAKIVKHMRTRHQDGDDHPLTLEDILDETNQLDVGQSVKNVRTIPAVCIMGFKPKAVNIFMHCRHP